MNSNTYILSAGLEFFYALVSAILLVGCLLDHDRKRLANRVMIAMLSVHTVMNLVDACIWLWCDVPSMVALMKVLSFVSYALGCALFAIFAYLLVCYIREYASVPKWVIRAIIALSGFMALLWVISIFNGMYYVWDENGICTHGDLYYMSQGFGALFLILSIALVLAYRSTLGRKDSTVLVLYGAIPLAAFAFVPIWDVVPVYTASTISLLLYYTIIHVEHGQRAAEQRERLIKQELELMNSRTAVMLSQIRPHFLYNTLSAIAQLCETSPQKAKETTLYFSEYLRRNMRALEQKEPILFEKELEHVKTYLLIEHVRFGDNLRVEYDIKATEFTVPALCLQPIVENAVKHGINVKEDGGCVTIQTRELPEHFEITVKDDGVGFDTARIQKDDGRHIGISNVRQRLESMMGAELIVTSQIGEGTVVTILIPKKPGAFGQDYSQCTRNPAISTSVSSSQ